LRESSLGLETVLEVALLALRAELVANAQLASLLDEDTGIEVWLTMSFSATPRSLKPTDPAADELDKEQAYAGDHEPVLGTGDATDR
jgi:hypothetical protein